MEFRPHDYQKRAINFILEHPASGLFLEMGLGKTAITLTAVDILMNDRFEISRVLVIAPLRVAEDTWSRESKSGITCSTFGSPRSWEAQPSVSGH